MNRAVKVTLKFATAYKLRQIKNLLVEYRKAVNFYIKHLWTTKGNLDKATLALLKGTRLSERYKSQTLRQALNIVISTKKSAKALNKKATRPIFKGAIILDAKFVSIEPGRNSFDLIIKLSTLKKYSRICVPTKKTQVLNKWIAKGGKLLQGCSLSEKNLSLFIRLPKVTFKKTGKPLGIDIGVNKLIADSNGKFYGQEFKTIRDKILRRKKGSKSRRRAYAERTNFINRTLNQLPWKNISILGMEDLKGIKTGKKKNRNKNFRKAMAPWVARQVLDRAKAKALENRVCPVEVPPAYTSSSCPICGKVSEKNRKGEKFQCIFCGHTGDADYIGALNILAKTLRFIGSVESPKPSDVSKGEHSFLCVA